MQIFFPPNQTFPAYTSISAMSAAHILGTTQEEQGR